MAKQPRSIAQISLRFTGIFEAELLLELMLRFWSHPLANDKEFSTNLLEQAAEVLRASVDNHQLFEDIAPPNVNLVAAIWYAERSSLSSSDPEPESEEYHRTTWLESIRRSLPSCFCNPDDLIE
jgi:hypothetical protein